MTNSSMIGRALATAAAALAGALIAATPAAATADRNNDGIPDRWEKRHGLSLNKNQAQRDQDRDGLRNKGEFLAKTDPRDDDSDGDGVEDGEEGAGVVSSFDPASGSLLIDLFSGDSVAGKVTPRTEIECENDDAVDPDQDEDGDDPESGDDHGDHGPGHDDDDHGSDDDGSWHDRRDDGENGDCSVDALVPGTVVREAELALTAAGLVYEEIELR